MTAHATPAPLSRLAAELLRLPPSCGPVRLVAVDGHAGSGKSTFADRLAEALGGAPVLRLDDIASHDALFDWTERLRRQVIVPLSRGETAHYETYDWHERRFGPGTRTLPPAPVVLVEGVGAGRRALRPFLARLLWMELPRDEAWVRGRDRDGAVQSEFWDGWEPAERRHFTEDPSRPFAQSLVRQWREGYEVLRGPNETAAQSQAITQSDGPEAIR
ncbi:uridine kinase family protein [Streptomyces sp. NPDC054866]